MSKILGKVEKTSRSQLIVEKFKSAIAEGRLKIGDKLPPERELAAELGVSRTSLREAIRFLSAYGILESIQGEGTFVTDKFTGNVFQFLGFGSTLNKENFRWLLKTREVLEIGSIDLAVENAAAGRIAQMQQLIDQLQAETDLEKMGNCDAKFHESIVALTKNPILVQIYKMIFNMLLLGTSKTLSFPEAKMIAVSDHREILDCIKNKQSDSCKKAIGRHLKATENLIEKYLEF